MTIESTTMSVADAAKDTNHGALHWATELFQSAAYTAVQQPIDGVTQLIDHLANQHLQPVQIVQKPVDDNGFTKVGNVFGLMADVGLASLGLKGVNGALGMDAYLSAAPAWGQAAITGAEAGTLIGLVSPVSDQGNFWINKARTTAITAGSFATMSGVNGALAPELGTSLTGRVSTGALSGAATGLVNVGLGDSLYGKAPTLGQVGDVASYALVGGAFGAAGWAAGKLGRQPAGDRAQTQTADAQADTQLKETPASSEETLPVVRNDGTAAAAKIDTSASQSSGSDNQTATTSSDNQTATISNDNRTVSGNDSSQTAAKATSADVQTDGVDFSGKRLADINLDKVPQAKTYQSIGKIMRGQFTDTPLFGKKVVATDPDGFPIKAGFGDHLILNDAGQPIAAQSGTMDVMYLEGNSPDDPFIFRQSADRMIVRAVPMAQPPEGHMLTDDHVPVQPGDMLIQNEAGEQWAQTAEKFGSQFWQVNRLHPWDNQARYNELPETPVLISWLQAHGFVPAQIPSTARLGPSNLLGQFKKP